MARTSAPSPHPDQQITKKILSLTTHGQHVGDNDEKAPPAKRVIIPKQIKDEAAHRKLLALRGYERGGRGSWDELPKSVRQVWEVQPVCSRAASVTPTHVVKHLDGLAVELICTQPIQGPSGGHDPV